MTEAVSERLNRTYNFDPNGGYNNERSFWCSAASRTS